MILCVYNIVYKDAVVRNALCVYNFAPSRKETLRRQ